MAYFFVSLPKAYVDWDRNVECIRKCGKPNSGGTLANIVLLYISHNELDSIRYGIDIYADECWFHWK